MMNRTGAGHSQSMEDERNGCINKVQPYNGLGPSVVDVSTAEHHTWGEVCDAWRLLDRDGLSVIEERVPAGGKEEWHYHTQARQLFYILHGSALMRTGRGDVRIDRGASVEIEPGLVHQIINPGPGDVRFLVISAPNTRGDRTVVVLDRG